MFVRAKMGEIRDLIKKALEMNKARGLSFSEIRDFVERKLKRHCADRVIVYNLQVFKEDNIAYRDEDGRWKLTDMYFNRKARGILKEILDEDLPISLHYCQDKVAFFKIGYGGDISAPELDRGMESIVFEQVQHEVLRILWKEKQEKRDLILGFAARSMWLSYLMSVNFMSDKKMAMLVKEAVGKVGNEARSLKELLSDKFRLTDAGWEALTFFLNGGLNARIDVLVEKLSDFEIRAISAALVSALLFDDKIIESVPSEHDENYTWLNKHDNDFSEFLEEVRKNRFAYVVAFGFPQTGYELNFLYSLGHFEEWFRALQRGDYDHRSWIFDQGKQTLDKMIYRMEHKKTRDNPLPEQLIVDLDSNEPWDLSHLYFWHPRGRDLEFYKSILEEIEKRAPIVKRRKVLASQGR